MRRRPRANPCRAVALALLAAGCAGATAPPATPTMYARLDDGVSRFDPAVALSLINAYRVGRGLPSLMRDATLEREAEARARAAIGAIGPGARAAPASDAGGRTGHVTAGYRTIAEAFSGWRESPSHDRVTLDPTARRAGLAAVSAPGTRYGVYWAVIVAP